MVTEGLAVALQQCTSNTSSFTREFFTKKMAEALVIMYVPRADCFEVVVASRPKVNF
jgi:hypothetical protein